MTRYKCPYVMEAEESKTRKKQGEKIMETDWMMYFDGRGMSY